MHHPFRGKTPPNTFQTVIVGGRSADAVVNAIERFENRGNKRNRDYAVVNPFFRSGGNWGHTAKDARWCKAIKKKLQQHGVHVFPMTAKFALRKMILKGQRTRHLYIEMPPGQIYGGSKKFAGQGWGAAKEMVDQVFAHATKVLLQGGQIFISTEGEYLIDYFIKTAKANSFSVRHLRTLEPIIKESESGVYVTNAEMHTHIRKILRSGRTSTFQTSMLRDPIYRATAIFHPKTIFKAKRKFKQKQA